MTRHQPILIIDADPDLGRVLVEQLLADGYPAKRALSAAHATSLAAHEPPAMVVLGTLDPPTGTLALLKTIREASTDTPWHLDVPVIVLGPCAHEADLLRAFEAGTDDYLPHPPSYLELRARLAAVLRRTTSPRDNRVLTVGPLVIDIGAHTATLHERHLALRPREYDLLVHLAGDPQRVFEASELLRTLWGYPAPCTTRTLDTHASRLRRKLGATSGRWVINVRGVGYRLI